MPEDRDSEPPKDDDEVAETEDAEASGGKDAPTEGSDDSSEDDAEDTPEDEGSKSASAGGASSDDEDDDEEEEEERPRPRKKKKKKKKKKRAAARPARRRKKRKPLPKNEAEIDSPTPQTLFMLGTVAALTLILWGSAKFACNAHPPQSKAPKAAAEQRLVRTPKGTAIEVQQRLATFQFDKALTLAKGELIDEIKKLKAECEKGGGGGCNAKRKRYSDEKVLTYAQLLEASTQGTAIVRVTTVGGEETDAKYIVELEFQDSKWKALKRVRDDGSFKPTPPPEPAADAAAAPSASASAAAPPAPPPVQPKKTPIPVPKPAPKAPAPKAPAPKAPTPAPPAPKAPAPDPG